MKITKGEEKIFFLNKRVIFPNTSTHLYIDISPSSQDISVGDTIIFAPVNGILSLFYTKKKFGSLCRILDKQELTSQIKLKIVCKDKVAITKVDNLKNATYSRLNEKNTPNNPVIEKLKKRSQELIFLINIKESEKLIELLNFAIDSVKMIDFISDHFITKFSHRYKIFNSDTIENRATLVLNHITKIVNKINKSAEKT